MVSHLYESFGVFSSLSMSYVYMLIAGYSSMYIQETCIYTYVAQCGSVRVFSKLHGSVHVFLND